MFDIGTPGPARFERSFEYGGPGANEFHYEIVKILFHPKALAQFAQMALIALKLLSECVDDGYGQRFIL